MKELRFLKNAKKASLNSNHHLHSIGCTLVKGGRIIGTGFNILKTSPRSPNRFFSIHAEVKAILSAKTDITGATAYIFRQTKDGTMALARPCQSCFDFLISHGIKNIVYSSEGYFKKEKIT